LKIQLRNRHTGKRETALSLSALPESPASYTPHYLQDDPRDFLRGHGFTEEETQFFWLFHIEDYTLREICEQLWMTEQQAEALRRRVRRKMNQLSYESDTDMSEKAKFGTDR
jgi:hypothetical protein